MESWIIFLTVAALILIFVEIFLVPGLGVTGILGTIALLVATYLASQEYGSLAALGLFLSVGILCIIAFVLFFRSPASQWIVLNQKLAKGAAQDVKLDMGNKGTTLTALRPSGKAVFILKEREKQFDVVTRGEFVGKDQPVEVLEIEGNRIVVTQKA